MKNRIIRLVSAAVLIAVAFFFMFHKGEKVVYQNTGNVFGTYYKITYESEKDLHEAILAKFKEFDASLSVFNKQSIISRINRNEIVTTDAYFEDMMQVAQRVSEQSNGAFDITVAPLVNAWGFGFKNKENVSKDSLMAMLQFIGYETIRLDNHTLIKTYPETQLDASAIAKGQACDIIADLLTENGCENFLVDIGGECVAKGVNQQGQSWRIGIVTPEDDPAGMNTEHAAIVTATDCAMATSGNYRQFYEDEKGIRRSHTIDPRSGYPVQHSLLSATVIAPTCMEADALATACMVLGEYALDMIEPLEDIECYLIYASENDYYIKMSSGMEKYILK